MIMENLPTCFRARQEALKQKLGPDSLAIVAAAPEARRNSDAFYRYRQDSDFYYLTGFNEPESVVVFAPGSAHGDTILFCRANDMAAEIWSGRRAGLGGAKEYYGADSAFPIQDLDHRMPELMAGRERLFYHYGQQFPFDQRVMNWLNCLRAKNRKGGTLPENLQDLSALTQEMRLFKGPEEIDAMGRAAQISATAHIRAMKAAPTAKFEYELEAEILYEFYRQGCRAPAYDSIVAGGENACILHYTDNNQPLKNDELILIDAGGEFQNYAADITRTFPKSGRFSGEQKALYELVYDAQQAGLAVAKPGYAWSQMQDDILRTITQGLVDLKIMSGNVDDLIEQKAYLNVYMHGSGHWLGLDVHDVGHYKIDDEWRKLEENMVLTVEPGIYISPNTPGIHERWWGIGIRIEDDVCITSSGHDVLSKDVPKRVDEIEALMSQQ